MLGTDSRAGANAKYGRSPWGVSGGVAGQVGRERHWTARVWWRRCRGRRDRENRVDLRPRKALALPPVFPTLDRDGHPRHVPRDHVQPHGSIERAGQQRVNLAQDTCRQTLRDLPKPVASRQGQSLAE